MPYKDINTRREKRREKNKLKVDVTCCVCGKTTHVRYDTSKKYTRFTCSKECKTQMLRELKSNEIDEELFISEYNKHEIGYQSLCKKYKIGGIRGRTILVNHGIEILKSQEMITQKRLKHLGNWNTGETKTCKKCGNTFKYRKGSTIGKYCSMECYIKNKKPSYFEKELSAVLVSLGVKFETQYSVGKSFYDFFIPSINTLIECDGEYWHSLPASIKRDKNKDALAIENGFNIIRITEDKLNNGELREVISCILQ